MKMIEALRQAQTLDQIAELSRSKGWGEYLRALSQKKDATEEIEALRRALADAKNRLSPEHKNPELRALKERVYQSENASPEALRPLLQQISSLREALPLRWHERLFGTLENEIGQLFSPQLTGSGYSNRAKRAKNLFTDFAGRTKIEGAATDKHGNAAGTAYDLGLDGAFTGHTIHVLQLYTETAFDFSLPGSAFKRKGFAMERRTTPGTPEELRRWLAEAKQLWLISDGTRKLKKEHIEVIKEYWQRGGALYIWGDNDPYYADANAVLEALFGADCVMKGNLPGRTVVHELSPSGVGFHAHLVTTGLEQLFEGITIASLPEPAIGKYGFTPLLYGSAKNLVTIVRDPTPTSGAVMVDTAFTRLYCQWDEAGSARYVCNAACFLAAMTLPEAVAIEEEPEIEIEEEKEALIYRPEGALDGLCDLTAEKPATWLVMSVAELGDSLKNTGDMVLTDPLCAGAQNKIFSEQLYGEQMGKWILSQGTDPFTRRPVVECLPLVDLSNKQNLREFTLLLCKCLMGGKYLPTAARMLFFAVVDQMYDETRRTDHPEAWEYLYRQCLANFTSTADFGDLGKQQPLLEAMTTYFSPATDESVQLRKSFITVGVIGRTLLREKKATPARIRAIARRSLIKTLVGDAVASEKNKPGVVQPQILSMLYHNFYGIPKLNGGRLALSWPSFARDLTTPRERLERELKGSLLTPEEHTIILNALLSLDLRQYTADTAVVALNDKDKAFSAVWRGEETPNAVNLLNKRFAAYQKMPAASDPHMSKVIPFVTTSGPSVYRCVCGVSFSDIKTKITDTSIEALAKARTLHFQAVYRAKGPTWYPAEGTLHYNLHRAVQRVITDHYPKATTFVDEMVMGVAMYLQEDAKGFLCDPLLEDLIKPTIESYLSLRLAGHAHPEGLLTLRLKAELEQKLAK
jgi:hypothetical protein